MTENNDLKNGMKLRKKMVNMNWGGVRDRSKVKNNE